MNKFNTLDKSIGYNVLFMGAPITYNLTKGMSAKGKLVRSKPVICVNTDSKEIFFADSMKLAADYLNTSKDMIKNANRLGKTYKRWNFFYVDDTDREYILNHNVIEGNISRISDRLGEAAKNRYIALYNDVVSFLKSDYLPENLKDYHVLEPLRYIYD